MRKWHIRRKIMNLITYHERMRSTFVYLYKQQSIGYHPDKMMTGCDLWYQQGWHYRYSERLRKILNNYK